MTEEQTQRLNNVYNNREKAIAENNAGYDSLLNDATALRDDTNAKAEQMQQEQDKIADANLAYQTNLINQQKEEAQKQTQKEQNKALNEYEFNKNPYGYNSEVIGQQGLSKSGVSETMKLGIYGAYQNRVATANASLQTAMTQYNNALLEAQKDNDVAKAQNALTKLQTQIANAETYFNNTSSLTQNKLNQINSINEQYDNQYNTVYNQILTEKQQAESIRQFNEQMAYQKERDAVADSQWEKEYQLSVANSKKSSSGGSSGGSSGKTNVSYAQLNNSADTRAKSDYYFKTSDGSQGYQPRYVNNNKLEKTGLTLKDIGVIDGVSGNKNIWTEGGNYYVWDEDHYYKLKLS